MSIVNTEIYLLFEIIFVAAGSTLIIKFLVMLIFLFLSVDDVFNCLRSFNDKQLLNSKNILRLALLLIYFYYKIF